MGVEVEVEEEEEEVVEVKVVEAAENNSLKVQLGAPEARDA